MELPLEQQINNYLNSIGYVPKVKKKKSTNIFSGLITVYMQHETVKVL